MSTMNSTSVSPSMSPSSLGHAPKFGTRIPNRVFVGGISSSTTETELFELFTAYGDVKATKIISDRAGVSKGYGFVTFANEDDAESVLREDGIMLRDRKLNIAPAVRKQPMTRYFGSQDIGSDTTGSSARLTPSTVPEWNVSLPDPSQVISNSTVFYHNGTPYVYPNGGFVMAATTADATCQYSQPAQAFYPVMYSPTLYLPQQPYQYPSPATTQTQWTGQQLRWAAQVNYGQSPSPQASATSTPHYMYTTNNSNSNSSSSSSSNNNSNNNTNNSSNTTMTGTTSNTSTCSTSSLIQQQHQVLSTKGAAGDSSVVGLSPAVANGCSSSLAYTTAAYAYATLPHQFQQNIYQQVLTPPQDYVDSPPPIIEASALVDGQPLSATLPYSPQDGTCATDTRAIQFPRHTSIRYARLPPPPYPSMNVDGIYRPPSAPFDYNNNNNSNNSNSGSMNSNNNSGGGRGHQRQRGQHQYGRPRFNYKSLSHGDCANQNKCPLTPPATPMVSDGSSDPASVTQKMEAMAI